MIINPMPAYRMCAASRRLTHKRGAFQHLQVVAELLRAGESRGRGQHISWLVHQVVSRNGWQCPRLLRCIFPAVVHVIQVRRMVEQVGGDKRDPPRTSTMVA